MRKGTRHKRRTSCWRSIGESLEIPTFYRDLLTGIATRGTERRLQISTKMQARRRAIGTATERENEQCQMFVSIFSDAPAHVKEKISSPRSSENNAEQGGMEPSNDRQLAPGNDGRACRSLLIPRKTEMRRASREDPSRPAVPVEEAVPGDERRRDRVVHAIERQRPHRRERQRQDALIAGRDV